MKLTDLSTGIEFLVSSDNITAMAARNGYTVIEVDYIGTVKVKETIPQIMEKIREEKTS